MKLTHRKLTIQSRLHLLCSEPDLEGFHHPQKVRVKASCQKPVLERQIEQKHGHQWKVLLEVVKGKPRYEWKNSGLEG